MSSFLLFAIFPFVSALPSAPKSSLATHPATQMLQSFLTFGLHVQHRPPSISFSRVKSGISSARSSILSSLALHSWLFSRPLIRTPAWLPLLQNPVSLDRPRLHQSYDSLSNTPSSPSITLGMILINLQPPSRIRIPLSG